MNDYRRPAPYQIKQLVRCDTCGYEGRYDSDQDMYGSRCPRCRGEMLVIGESYPASADDWDEERDTVDGEWRRRR